jgi:hypothetical protein
VNVLHWWTKEQIFSELDVVGQPLAPVALSPEKETRYKLDRRFGVPQSRSGRRGA